MLHGTFENIDKASKTNDSKDIILLSKVKSGIGMNERERAREREELCPRHYSSIEWTSILSFNPHYHPLKKCGYKKQILKGDVDLERVGWETISSLKARNT